MEIYHKYVHQFQNENENATWITKKKTNKQTQKRSPKEVLFLISKT